ncbi:HEAT repeat domain-containing protein [Actinoplanes sp. NPDC024001]|uniref:HEAT repeat domain-containing protein n=1 Tax=Actinoplanes sp. NPDC024001 TaxID=3154598 RepID=UPI0033CB7C6E
MNSNAPAYRSRRLVLQDPGDDAGSARIAAVAERRGWQTSDIRTPGRSSREQVWTVSADVTFHHVVDQNSGIPYVEFRSRVPNVISTILSEVRDELRVFTSAELLEAVRDEPAPDELPRALLHLGLAAPPRFSDDYFDEIYDGLENPDPTVRRAAVWATVYTEWPEWVPVVGPLSEEDPDDEVRRLAREAVHLLERALGDLT